MALLVKDFVELLQPIVDEALELANDGKFDFGDLLKVAPRSVKILMGIAADVKGASGAEKKAFVVEAFQWTYIKLDPDIPWIPEIIENPLEAMLLSSLVPSLIESFYDEMKEKLDKKDEG